VDDLRQRQDVVCRGRDCDLAAENIEQQSDPPGIVEIVEDRQLLGERSRQPSATGRKTQAS
jgi:hypothetical protein